MRVNLVGISGSNHDPKTVPSGRRRMRPLPNPIRYASNCTSCNYFIAERMFRQAAEAMLDSARQRETDGGDAFHHHYTPIPATGRARVFDHPARRN